MKVTKRYLDVRFDVTDFNDDEIGALSLEAVVQGESSEEHPSAEVETEINEVETEVEDLRDATLAELVGEPDGIIEALANGELSASPETKRLATAEMALRTAERERRSYARGDRTILVHLNVELPAGDTRSADEISDALGDAITFAAAQKDSTVAELTVVVPLAEEI